MSRRRRISISSIIGPRIAYYNHWLLKRTSTSPSLFVLFRSFSNTTKNPTSHPQGHEPKPKALPKQPWYLGPNHLHSALISFNRMLRMRPLPPISQFNKALGSILKMAHYATALSLIHNKLQQFQAIQVNFYTFNIAINYYCRLNRVDFGLSLLGTLFKRSYTPDVTTFTTPINGLILQDKTPQAVKLVKKLMRTREIEPNVVMYGTIVNGLCRTGNTFRAVSLLRIMEEGSYEPNTVVYTMIIDNLCKDRMVDDAFKLFSTMDEKGIFPNVVTYTSLIHGLCNFGRWKEAAEMFKGMLDSGIAPNVHSYSVLLNACTKEGKMKGAEGVLEFMI
ncbi:pentatricopeptide repeat-containing protein At1g63400-like [Camellia sinensis]|uniref:pentatricopeptide repeat-containing protein At1g63400-like n=1 Tax=Camellia sinensis TaxID=4442 RepID=UPI0010358D83|nr:pentatricopeptide repeat-containing protein At1g63400-like [Camellia sinensis]